MMTSTTLALVRFSVSLGKPFRDLQNYPAGGGSAAYDLVVPDAFPGVDFDRDHLDGLLQLVSCEESRIGQGIRDQSRK